jgi:hypothetical protein
MAIGAVGHQKQHTDNETPRRHRDDPTDDAALNSPIRLPAPLPTSCGPHCSTVWRGQQRDLRRR